MPCGSLDLVVFKKKTEKSVVVETGKNSTSINKNVTKIGKNSTNKALKGLHSS